jgi:hypothetical protein
VNAERSGALLLLCGDPSAQTADREDWGMMTDDERNKLERMLQHDDDGSRKLAHMLKLLTELRSVVVDDRPDHALLLAEEVYAAFDSLPAELRQMIDEKFRRMEARTLIH